jgi:hypothetical protein
MVCEQLCCNHVSKYKLFLCFYDSTLFQRLRGHVTSRSNFCAMDCPTSQVLPFLHIAIIRGDAFDTRTDPPRGEQELGHSTHSIDKNAALVGVIPAKDSESLVHTSKASPLILKQRICRDGGANSHSWADTSRTLWLCNADLNAGLASCLRRSRSDSYPARSCGVRCCRLKEKSEMAER